MQGQLFFQFGKLIKIASEGAYKFKINSTKNLVYLVYTKCILGTGVSIVKMKDVASILIEHVIRYGTHS